MQFTLNELKSYNYMQYQMNSNECEVMALQFTSAHSTLLYGERRRIQKMICK